MGEALLSRLITKQIYQPNEIVVSDPQLARRQYLNEQYGVRVTDDNGAIARDAETLLLAIKPQVFETVAAEIAPMLPAETDRPSIVSILAGMPLSKLEAAFEGKPVLRVMPNTPATVGTGMSAISPGRHVRPEHLERARAILTAVGSVVEVPESLMDAVTGLSGSGPGYVALMIEALSDGGVASGLPRAIAAQLALQTVLGAARLLDESGMHPAELKDRVTSPGGTTIAGIARLEAGGLRSALIEAVRAATDRSRELGHSDD